MTWHDAAMGAAKLVIGLVCFGAVATVAWIVEREIRRRARARRDREWYRAPPKRMPKKWLH
jgi:hypothetical protein